MSQIRLVAVSRFRSFPYSKALLSCLSCVLSVLQRRLASSLTMIAGSSFQLARFTDVGKATSVMDILAASDPARRTEADAAHSAPARRRYPQTCRTIGGRHSRPAGAPVNLPNHPKRNFSLPPTITSQLSPQSLNHWSGRIPSPFVRYGSQIGRLAP
ncbi:hypothetical protein C8J56DRAFT_63634 [Mycena floridula]|nr:hypothetical protein C8J56DRAFT_63634 [Mycena floridula]